MKTRKNRIFLASEADNRACQLLWEPLSLGECEVLRCETTKDLLARTGESQLPQLVLMHTSLGGSRVFDFCRIFNNRFPTVPLVLLAEQVEPGVRHWAMKQGATDLLPIGKEKDRQYLLQRLSSLLTTPPIQTKVTSMMAVASPSVASK
jgi:CheY-like chemotaxis protein